MPKRRPRRKPAKKPTDPKHKPKPSTANVDALALYLGSKVEGVVREWRFHETRRWRFDIAVPSLMLAVEYEGGAGGKSRHTSFSGFLGDLDKYSTATAMGWWVLRFAHRQLKDGTAFQIIDAALERLTGEKK